MATLTEIFALLYLYNFHLNTMVCFKDITILIFV